MKRVLFLCLSLCLRVIHGKNRTALETVVHMSYLRLKCAPSILWHQVSFVGHSQVFMSTVLISNEITLLPDVLSFPLRNVFGKQSKITFGEFLSYTFLMIRRPQRSTLFPYRRSSDLSFSSISVVWRWGWGVVFRTKGR
uniref:Secreted protein n=1 Tax=Cacopsylla melanoneura TaxID=428564 RepID=A0A8D8Q852_9HEMI